MYEARSLLNSPYLLLNVLNQYRIRDIVKNLIMEVIACLPGIIQSVPFSNEMKVVIS